MANSVDLDQTAVWNESTPFAFDILSEILVYQSLGHIIKRKNKLQLYPYLLQIYQNYTFWLILAAKNVKEGPRKTQTF